MTEILTHSAPFAAGATALREPFLFLYITEKCPLRCKHCYMGERLDRERKMTPAYVEQVLEALRITYGQYKVYLLGGEPTTHPQFSEILDVCKRQGYKAVLTTNGLMPARTWPALDERIDSFSFSMDGARPETHEAMRGPNTWRPLVVSMNRAIEAGFQTRAIFTVTTANCAEVFTAIDFADDIGLEMLSFHYFTPTGLGRARPEFQLPPADWLALCDRIRAHAAGKRVRVFYPPAFAPAEQLPALRQAGYSGCTARNLERLAVFPDGRVYICSMFFDTDLHYGTIVDGQVVPRTPTAGLTELTLVNRVSANCRGCPHGSACGGGCAAYDHLGATLTSSDCDRHTVPVCPLWSMPAAPEATEHRLIDLR
ncbi:MULTISPECIES: radical SAM/SPASM domain-containing protein [Nocardia]|uniref:radical SAM/SPASM domain-containing protein n=1 Tax=Nocardia TaxID=1817 RepID=UPI001893DBF8|nr:MULTISPECIES: radical SAM protein [Nocardia]MBF6216231.1 radical SAM protein [Nocardia puris]MBF6574102.1 radical SAM protein [Nocardia farcinica]